MTDLRKAVLAALLVLAACQHDTIDRSGRTAPTTGEASVRPGVNDRYFKNPEVERWKKRFERPDREIYRRRHEILERMRLRPGMVVADVGAGTGFFSLLFARAVGEAGKVYAVDILPSFIAHIRREAGAAGLSNVETVLCKEDDVSLPPESIDVAFLCDVYHHFEYPRSSMASIRRALRPGGELVLVDFRRIPGRSSRWVMDHVRAGQAVFSAEIVAAGFEGVGEESFMKSCYFLRFRKKP